MTRIQKRAIERKVGKGTIINDKIVKLDQLPIFEKGKDVIYPEQQICAFNIKKILDENKDIAIMLAQPQMGKTGACVYLVHLIMTEWKKFGVKGQIVFLGNYADNDLKDQTRKRLKKFELISEDYQPEEEKMIFDFHRGDYKNNLKIVLKRIRQGVPTVVIVDECHIALGKHGLFNTLMKEMGVKYGKQKSTWTYQNVQIVGVSATPFAYNVKEMISSGGFTFSKMPINSNYYSLEQMRKDGRLFSSERVISKLGKKSTASVFFKERIKQFIENCEKQGNGYMVLRVSSIGMKSILEKYIHDNHKNMASSLFACKGGNPIEDLSTKLARVPEKPTVIFILKALGAGKTIETTKNIRMWIDTPISNADTVIQSIGRVFGYATPLDKTYSHSKFKDTFPVFCDIKELDNAIEYYKSYDGNVAIPSSLNNPSTIKNSRVGNGYILIFDAKDKEAVKLELRKLIKPVENELLEFHNNQRALTNKYLYENPDLHITYSRISTTNENDLADWVRNFLNRGNVDKEADKTRGVRLIHVDKIKKDNTVEGNLKIHTNSFNLLKKEMPHVIGKIVYMISEQEYEIFMSTKKRKGYKHISDYKNEGKLLNPPSEPINEEVHYIKPNCVLNVESDTNSMKNQQNLKQKSKIFV